MAIGGDAPARVSQCNSYCLEIYSQRSAVMTRYLFAICFCMSLIVSLPCFAGDRRPVTSPSRSIATSDLATPGVDGRAQQPVLSAGLRLGLVWKRTSANSQALEG